MKFISCAVLAAVLDLGVQGQTTTDTPVKLEPVKAGRVRGGSCVSPADSAQRAAGLAECDRDPDPGVGAAAAGLRRLRVYAVMIVTLEGVKGIGGGGLAVSKAGKRRVLQHCDGTFVMES